MYIEISQFSNNRPLGRFFLVVTMSRPGYIYIYLSVCLSVPSDPGLSLVADMENVQNFTRAGLFVSRFYPKVRELRQI